MCHVRGLLPTVQFRNIFLLLPPVQFRNILRMYVRMSGAGSTGYEDLANRFRYILDVARLSFAQAAAEPKLTSRHELLQRNAAALVTVDVGERVARESKGSGGGSAGKKARPAVMRKHMTRALEEILSGQASSSSCH